MRDKLFSTNEAAYAVDRDGQIIVWNKAAEQTLGYAESEALGQKCWELLSGRDVFGNQSCCEGCPVRATAFNNEPINRFQIDFKTATQKRKRFSVSTLMLFNNPGKEVFIHLCRPESKATDGVDTKSDTNHSSVNNKPIILTPKETEVLALLHKGMRVQEIAADLAISSSTVRNHTQHIFKKLDTHSRFEAVAKGRKLNLI